MNLGFSIWKLAQNYKDCNTNPFVDAVEGGRIKVSIDFRDNKDLTEAENFCKAKKYDLFYLVFQDTKWHCPCICMFIDTPKDVNELYNNIQNKQLTWRQAIILYKTENHEIDLSILKGNYNKGWQISCRTTFFEIPDDILNNNKTEEQEVIRGRDYFQKILSLFNNINLDDLNKIRTHRILENIFPWLDFFEELANKLNEFYNVENKIAITTKLLNKIEDNSENIPIKSLLSNDNKFISNIDPFTIFQLMNRILKIKNRLEIAKKLKEFFNVDAEIIYVDSFFNGVPSLSTRTSRYCKLDNKIDVRKIWILLKRAINFADKYENENKFLNDFKNVLKYVNGCGMSNLTQALFWIRPSFYPSADKNIIAFLNAKYGKMQVKVNNVENYLNYKDFLKTNQNELLKIIIEILRTNEIFISIDAISEEDKNRYYNIILSYAAWLYEENVIMEKGLSLLNANKQLILTGAPGTGKTYMAFQIAASKILDCPLSDITSRMIEVMQRKSKPDPLNDDEKKLYERFRFCQFHPGYDYSDFVEGLRPVQEGEKGIVFKRRLGVFGELCLRAFLDQENSPNNGDNQNNANNYVMMIDEINRAELSRVLGELFFGLEEGYRGVEINTPYSTMNLDLENLNDLKDKEIEQPFKLRVPQNLFIIGTMNDIDRSVDSMDFALRRRFAWLEVTAESSKRIIDSHKEDGTPYIEDERVRNKLKECMNTLNNLINGTIDIGETKNKHKKKLCEILGKEYQLGGAYFIKYGKYQNEKDSFEMLWNNHLLVVLMDYLRSEPDRVEIIEALHKQYQSAISDKQVQEEGKSINVDSHDDSNVKKEN